MGMLQPYEDRKKLKWQGFFLSEHTTEIEEESTRTFDCPPKPSLSPRYCRENQRIRHIGHLFDGRNHRKNPL